MKNLDASKKITIIDRKNGWYEVRVPMYSTARLVCNSMHEALFYAENNADGDYL